MDSMYILLIFKGRICITKKMLSESKNKNLTLRLELYNMVLLGIIPSIHSSYDLCAVAPSRKNGR